MNKATTGLLATAIATATGSLAHAACPVDGATPFFAGAPKTQLINGVSFTNGFSEYVTASTGLAPSS